MQRIKNVFGDLSRRIWPDRRGAAAVMFALSAVPLMIAVGSGVDLTRAYTARQQLSAVAALTCQYANRPGVAELAFGSNGTTTYTTAVQSYYSKVLASQNATWSQTTAAPFHYTPGGAGDVSLTASIPTSLMNVAGITSLPIAASAHCFNILASGTQPVQDAPTTVLVREGFENTAAPNSFRWYLPGGTNIGYSSGQLSLAPVNTPPKNAGYVGSGGTEWIIMGYCLEVDTVGETVTTVPEGTHSAELDCDNGSGTAGNSSISTRVYLQSNSYELRWSYATRIINTTYDPAYICGSAAADTSWANDTSYVANNQTYGARTNQINAYLDQDTTGSPPTHTTLDGTQTLGGSNLIDQCVYASVSNNSADWIQRSVPITVTTAGYYWLSFAADGASDSYGGQIDNIMLCRGSCTGSVKDNFPSDWLAANNSGSYKKLFEDTFESPTYPAYSGNVTPNGNLNNSLGTSGSGSGWPGQASSGWVTAPTNSVMYFNAAAAQGTQSIQLDNGWTYSGNKAASRNFLLVPGYYKITYDYVATAQFASLSGTYCGATPSAANIGGLSGSGPATYRSGISGSVSGNQPRDTNIIGLFMSHALLVSAPIGGGALNSTTSYVNPDGTTSVTPSVAPNGVSMTNYNTDQVNPLIDLCGYAQSWQARSAYVRIVKPAYYWLTMSGLGTSDGQGGSIDDITLAAMDGPFMTNAPSAYVTIPVPDPQPLATLSFTGFSIIAGSQYK